MGFCGVKVLIFGVKSGEVLPKRGLVNLRISIEAGPRGLGRFRVALIRRLPNDSAYQLGYLSGGACYAGCPKVCQQRGGGVGWLGNGFVDVIPM